MQWDVALHKMIEDFNFIVKKPAQIAEAFFKNHKTVYKVVLVINHFFRTIAMAALCTILPYSFPANIAICFAGSLFYRLTVEPNCSYKFALPAFFGSLTLPSALTSLTLVISGVAFISLGTLITTCFYLVPFVVYATYVVLTVNYDVDHQCCKKK